MQRDDKYEKLTTRAWALLSLHGIPVPQVGKLSPRPPFFIPGAYYKSAQLSGLHHTFT